MSALMRFIMPKFMTHCSSVILLRADSVTMGTARHYDLNSACVIVKDGWWRGDQQSRSCMVCALDNGCKESAVESPCRWMGERRTRRTSARALMERPRHHVLRSLHLHILFLHRKRHAHTSSYTIQYETCLRTQ